MKERITRINRTLFELETGILIYGIICQIFVFLVKDKAGYSLGLWMGVVIGMVGAFHMWWTLDRALDLGEREAVKTMSTHNVLRYFFYCSGICTDRHGRDCQSPCGIFRGYGA